METEETDGFANCMIRPLVFERGSLPISLSLSLSLSPLLTPRFG